MARSARSARSASSPVTPSRCLRRRRKDLNGVRLSNTILLPGWLGREVPFGFDEGVFDGELNARFRVEGTSGERS